MYIFSLAWDFFGLIFFSNYNWEALSAIAQICGVIITLLAVIAALAAPFVQHYGIELRKKPNLVFIALPAPTNQGNGWNEDNTEDDRFKVFRIVINNDSNYSAQEVRALCIITKGEDVSGIPIYLNWTHFNELLRDIHPHENVYLDLFNYIDWRGEKYCKQKGIDIAPFEPENLEKRKDLFFTTNPPFPRKLFPSSTPYELTIVLYEKSGSTFQQKILVEWVDKIHPPKVSFIS